MTRFVLLIALIASDAAGHVIGEAHESDSALAWSFTIFEMMLGGSNNTTIYSIPPQCKEGQSDSADWSWWTRGKWALVGFYALAIFLLLVYMSWDDGPIHVSRLRETFYLATVLALIYFPTSAWFLLRIRCTQRTEDGRTSDINLEWILFTTLCLYILMRFVRTIEVSKLHSLERRVANPAHGAAKLSISDNGAAIRQIATKTSLSEEKVKSVIEAAVVESVIAVGPDDSDGQDDPKGVRLVAELKMAIAKAKATSWSSAADNALVPVLMSGLVMQQFIVAFPWVLDGCRLFFHIVICMFFFSMCYNVLWRQFIQQRHITMMKESLLALVDQKLRESFQYVLTHVNVGTIMELVGLSILDMMVDRALQENLHTPETKAIVIDALQKTGLRNKRKQQAARQLILETKGKELVRLKALIDSGGDYHNLCKLVYSDMGTDIQKDVIQHLIEEATEVRKKNNGNGIMLKIVSDIDDTLFSSGGSWPAGWDKKFPKHVIYPGCLQLFKELDQSWSSDYPESEKRANLVFLTARPHVFKDVSLNSLYEEFEDLVNRGIMHSMPTILPGKLSSGLQGLLSKCKGTRSWEAVGEDKYRAYGNYRQLYLEFDFVFFGDDGQGDLYAGQRMLQEPQDNVSALQSRPRTSQKAGCRLCDPPPDPPLVPPVKFAIIHKVLPEKQKPPLEYKPDVSTQIDTRPQSDRLIKYNTYVGAALQLHKADPNLLSTPRLKAIAKRAILDFDQSRLQEISCSDFLKEAEDELKKDIDDVKHWIRQKKNDTGDRKYKEDGPMFSELHLKTKERLLGINCPADSGGHVQLCSRSSEQESIGP